MFIMIIMIAVGIEHSGYSVMLAAGDLGSNPRQ